MNTNYPFGGYAFRPSASPTHPPGRTGVTITEQQVRAYEDSLRIAVWQLHGINPDWWILDLEKPQVFNLRVTDEDASGVTLGWDLSDITLGVYGAQKEVTGYLGANPWDDLDDSMELLPDSSLFVPAPATTPAKVLIKLQPYGEDLMEGGVYRMTLSF